MARTGKVTLAQGTGKNSGKPYTALKIEVGKWSTLHFPTPFEKDYLVDFFGDNKEAELTLNENGTLRIQAGDYVHNYKIESQFEEKYVGDYIRAQEEPAKPVSDVDATLDLDNEDKLNENPFN